jgi:hypothetical protein
MGGILGKSKGKKAENRRQKSGSVGQAATLRFHNSNR